jgi:hypothetical protein
VFEAIVETLPLWDRAIVDRLPHLCGPQSHSDVILALAN